MFLISWRMRTSLVGDRLICFATTSMILYKMVFRGWLRCIRSVMCIYSSRRMLLTFSRLFFNGWCARNILTIKSASMQVSKKWRLLLSFDIYLLLLLPYFNHSNHEKDPWFYQLNVFIIKHQKEILLLNNNPSKLKITILIVIHDDHWYFYILYD